MMTPTTDASPVPGRRGLRETRRVKLCVVAVVLASLVGCTPAPAPRSTSESPDRQMPAPTTELTALYNQKLTWRDCDGLQCSTVRAPRDWSDPGGATIPLALTRRPASGQRDGVVVLNLGGPGVAGAELLRSNPDSFGTEALREQRDLVAFDPRGTGDSAPVDCLTDAQLDGQLSGRTADQHVAAEYRAGCSRLSAPVATIDTIKDLDLIRAVLDQPSLDYLGFSYGTKIGAGYLQHFGSHAGHFVLDGPLPPGLTLEQMELGQSAGMHHALTRFVDACLAGELGDCPLTGPRDQAFDQLRDLLAGADGLHADRQVTPTLAATGVMAGLYRRSDWRELKNRLASAENGDGSGLLAAADAYTGRQADGRYPSNVMEAYWAITCSDFAVRDHSKAQLAVAQTRIARVSPVLGRYLGSGQEICSEWASAPKPPASKAVSGLTGPPLILAATDDPATPYRWARDLQGQLRQAQIVTRRGDGHTSLGMGNDCVDDAVNRYLLEEATPEPTTC